MVTDWKFSELTSVAASLRNTLWVNKLIAHTDTFDGEFDVLSRIEYSRALLQTAASNSVLTDIAVLVPAKDLVVTPAGWFTFSDYSTYLQQTFRIEYQTSRTLYQMLQHQNYIGDFTDFEYNTSDHPQFLMLQSLTQTSVPQGTILLMIDRSKLVDQAMIYSGKSISSLALQNRELLLLAGSCDDASPNSYEIRRGSQLFNLTYVFTYPNPKSQIPYLLAVNRILILIPLLLLASAGLSYFLARISCRPLKKITNLIRDLNTHEAAGQENEDYELIESTVYLLYGKTQTLQQQLDLYYRAAKNDFLVKLLKGCFGDDISSAIEMYRLPFGESDLYAVLMINLPPQGSIAQQERERLELTLAVQKLLEQRGLVSQVPETVNDDLVVILAFQAHPPTREQLLVLAEELREELFQTCQLSAEIYCGDIYQGFLGISKSYQELAYVLRRNDMVTMFGSHLLREGARYYYPTDWQIQLIKQLKAGNLATVTQILNEIRQENDQRTLYRNQRIRLLTLLAENIQRAADEVNIPLDFKPFYRVLQELQDSGEGQEKLWNILQQQTACLCGEVNRARQDGVICTDDPIIRYVNENFACMDMSLKEVGSRFNMSVSSVSKAFKEHSNINFYDYVTGLRMEKAKELLRGKQMDISEVARAVGYENDYSFRRAFQRYEKVRPSDYARREEETHVARPSEPADALRQK
ncbi:MAG: helix-turn-helix domain-containing protein [Firmicutes bacterium]|nr:helix-turn-helix domain-containing protein [Bacillota bacterium]